MKSRYSTNDPRSTRTQRSPPPRCCRGAVWKSLTFTRSTALDEQGTRETTTAVGTFGTPEEAATAHFRSLGFEVVFCESRAFHVLFGVYMWLLIQDSADSLHRLMGFRDRAANGERQEGCLMKTASRTTKSRSSTAPPRLPRRTLPCARLLRTDRVPPRPPRPAWSFSIATTKAECACQGPSTPPH